MRSFHDLGLQYPGSVEQAAALVREAGSLGYARVCINVPVRCREDLARAEALKGAGLGDAVLVGAELDVPPGSRGALHNLVARASDAADVVAVLGGDLAVNKYAVDSRGIDVLRAPYRGRRDSGVDKAVAEAAARNGVALEVRFSDVLSVRGSRIPLLGALMELASISGAFSAPVVVTSGASVPLGMRAPRDLVSFAACLGMGRERAQDTMSTNPERVVRSALDRADERVIAPGVRVV